jgi:hypothetical protein
MPEGIELDEFALRILIVAEFESSVTAEAAG